MSCSSVLIYSRCRFLANCCFFFFRFLVFHFAWTKCAEVRIIKIIQFCTSSWLLQPTSGNPLLVCILFSLSIRIFVCATMKKPLWIVRETECDNNRLQNKKKLQEKAKQNTTNEQCEKVRLRIIRFADFTDINPIPFSEYLNTNDWAIQLAFTASRVLTCCLFSIFSVPMNFCFFACVLHEHREKRNQYGSVNRTNDNNQYLIVRHIIIFFKFIKSYIEFWKRKYVKGTLNGCGQCALCASVQGQYHTTITRKTCYSNYSKIESKSADGASIFVVQNRHV